MPDLGKAYVQIVPSAKGISGSIEQSIAPGAAHAGTSAGKLIASNIGSTMQSVGGGLMKAGAIATAVSVPIIAGIKSALGSYEVQAAAETKLTEIYKTRMGASEKAAKATMEYASALQKTGIIGDEVQLSGAQQLATFAKMPDTVNTLLPAMNNLLAQQKGYSATAEDATGIANLMGKVMNGQVGALKRVGISFDENSEKILKNGTEEEKAAELAKVITDNVGNMNEVMAETPLGKIQQMKNAFGDLQEQLGAQFAPILSQVAEFISAKILPAVQQVIDFMQGNPIIAQVTLAIAGLLAVGGPLLIILGAIVSAVGALIPVVTAISAPVVAVAAGIAALIAVLATAYTQSESFRNAINQLGSELISIFAPLVRTVVSGLKELASVVVQTATSVANDLAPVIEALMPVITAAAKILVAVLGFAFQQIVTRIKTVASIVKSLAKIFSVVFLAVVAYVKGAQVKIGTIINAIKNIFNSLSSVVGKVKSTFNSVKEAITHPIKTAVDVVKSAISRIKGLFPLHVGKIFSGIKLPKFNVSGGSAPWGIGGKGSMPSIHLTWAAKGAIVDGATLIGAGEKGPEAIVPLDPFWKRLDKTMGRGATINATFNITSDNGEQIANTICRKLEMEMRS